MDKRQLSGLMNRIEISRQLTEMCEPDHDVARKLLVAQISQGEAKLRAGYNTLKSPS